MHAAGSAGQGITSNHETYLISADSAQLADSWVAAIRRVIHEVRCVCEGAITTCAARLHSLYTSVFSPMVVGCLVGV